MFMVVIETLKYILYKCKNHFNEMKGDVGMSLHEKEGNKKNLHQADNPSLHLCFKKIHGLLCLVLVVKGTK